MPRLPRPKIRLPHLSVRRPHLRPGRPRLRLPKLKVPRYQAGALWVLVVLAALATLPSLVPGQGSGRTFGASGLSAQDEDGRYQAWLRGRAASQAAGAQAAAQKAAAGPGAAAPTPPVTTPTASDNDIPAMALQAYRWAESWASGFDPGCKLSWSVLAGIGRIESNHGRHFGSTARFSLTGDVTPTILGPVLNGAASTGAIHDSDGGRLDGDMVWDRAVGPMQFIPSTWASLGRDGNNDGIANPSNLFDAAVSAAGYLCLSGGGSLADQANLRRAVYAYNHSWDYVSAVLTWADFYLRGEGSLVQVQVPSGMSGGQPGGDQPGMMATLPGGGSGSGPDGSGPDGSPSSSRAGATPTSKPGSSTASPTSGPPTPPPTTSPPPNSSTSTTSPPTTQPCPGATTTTSSTTSSTTTTTTTTGSSTTTTTTVPCPGQEGSGGPDGSGPTPPSTTGPTTSSTTGPATSSTAPVPT